MEWREMPLCSACLNGLQLLQILAILHLAALTANVDQLMVKRCVLASLAMSEVHHLAVRNARSIPIVYKTWPARTLNVRILAPERVDLAPNVL